MVMWYEPQQGVGQTGRDITTHMSKSLDMLKTRGLWFN